MVKPFYPKGQDFSVSQIEDREGNLKTKIAGDVSNRLRADTRVEIVWSSVDEKAHFLYETQDKTWHTVCEQKGGNMVGDQLYNLRVGNLCADCLCDLAFAGIDNT